MKPTNIPIDQIAGDSQVVSLEDFLAQNVRRPTHRAEEIRLSAKALLQLLRVENANVKEQKRAAAWMRANGFRSVQNGYVFKVCLIPHLSIDPKIIV